MERELLATKNYLNTVFNSIHDAVFVHDLKGCVVDVNDKMLDLYRLTREKAVGLSIDLDYTTPEERPDLPVLWANVMAGQDALVECRGRRPKDSFEFDAETYLTKLSLPGGAEVHQIHPDAASDRGNTDDLLGHHQQPGGSTASKGTQSGAASSERGDVVAHRFS